MATEHLPAKDEIKEPYVGPRPFEEKDEDVFFGREQETNELISLIVAHPLVLLYAQSGAGKTSLLKASLLPILKKRKIEVLPPARVRGQGTQSDDAVDGTNIYVSNALEYLSGNSLDPNQRAAMSLTDFLPPRQPTNRREVLPLRVVIFDQFEEIFTVYPERFEDRQNFFEQVRNALESDTLLRIVFAMREDFIAELDPYTSILPERLQTRYRLMRLNEHSARAAIEKPLERANQSQSLQYVFEPAAADKVVDNLRTIYVKTPNGEKTLLGPFIEPVHLQVVCQTLWRKLGASFSQNTENKEVKITEDDVKEFGDVDKALSEFYEGSLQAALETVAATTRKSDKFPKLTEGILRAWFGRTLITPAGARGTVFGGRRDETVGGIPRVAVNELEKQRLIRAELRGSEMWYELSHDRFIQPIRDSNEKWLRKQPLAQRKAQDLEARASEWAGMNKSRSLLLDQADLRDAKRWMESPEAAGIGYSDTLFAFIQVSQAAQQQRRVKQLIGGSAVLAILLVAMVGTTIYAFQKRTEAEYQKVNAEKAQAEAVMAKDAADAARSEAIRQQEIAEEQRKAAKEAESKAVKEGQAAREAETLAKKQQQVATTARTEAERQRQIAEISEGEARRRAEELLRERAQVALGFQAAGSAFSPDGKLLVTVSQGSKVRLWDVQTGYELAQLADRSITVSDFSPSGRFIATGSEDNTVKLWSIESQKTLSTLRGHTDRVRKLVFSPDERRLVTASDDSTARVWDVESGKEIMTLQGHTGPVLNVAFSPDGKVILTTSTDGTIRMWNAVTGEIIRAINNRPM
jgi:hypothetical protein